MSNQVYSNDTTPYPVTATIDSASIQATTIQTDSMIVDVALEVRSAPLILVGSTVNTNLNPPNNATELFRAVNTSSTNVAILPRPSTGPNDSIVLTQEPQILTNKTLVQPINTGVFRFFTNKLFGSQVSSAVTIGNVPITVFASDPIPGNQTIFVKAWITAYCTAGPDINKSAIREISSCVRCTAGAVTTVGPTTNTSLNEAGLNGLSASVAPGIGAVFLVSVTGLVGDTFAWGGFVQAYYGSGF